MSIPKIIHYVWVGEKPLPPLAKKCVASWQRYLPDYELKLWNEQILPKEVLEHPYVKAMYQQKKWAFVADYARFWALEQYGGVYLDTDTEVLKNFDPLLQHRAFFGQTKDGVTAAGVIGALPQHPIIAKIKKTYDTEDTSQSRTSPQIVTEVLSDMGNEEKEGVEVYDYRYFNPCDEGEKCSNKKLALAYANNHWAESWVPFRRARKLARRLGVMPVLKWVTKFFKK